MKIGRNTRIWHPHLSILLEFVCGDECVIHSHVWIGHDVKIGHRCKIQAGAYIPSGVTIGDDCFIGPSVTFTNDRYPPSDHIWHTTVRDKVSIGAGAVIVAGVMIGEGALIGAGAVVTADIERGAKVIGNPARPL